jgi:hypothetical protein
VSAGPDVVARELVPRDPATLEPVVRVAIMRPEERFCPGMLVVMRDNAEVSVLDVGLARTDDHTGSFGAGQAPGGVHLGGKGQR